MEPCRDFTHWRIQARSLLAEKIHYNEVDWGGSGFSFGETFQAKNGNVQLSIPKEFMRDAVIVAAFREDSTWSLLYRLAWRLLYENRDLFGNPLDEDVSEFGRRLKLVTRDMHKMKAFVRFREVRIGEELHYYSWHRPDHRIIHLIAPFFRDRFNGMNWTIMTEDGCATWDKKELTFSPGVERSALPPDGAEDLWRTYYSSVFNPARIKESAMKKEMPVRYWKTLPESELITGLMQEAPNRLEEFYDSQRASAPTERFASLSELNSALSRCGACEICPKATAPVPGEGPGNARVMIVGEQPGNEEDKAGRPFQGPSGELLDEVLKRSGFRREDIYVTNAVKGFKHVIINSFRQHRTAQAREISSCRPWVKEELRLIQPELIICLGRTAAQSLLGKMIKMEDVRGKVMTSPLGKMVILPHPASILRSQEDQNQLRHRYIDDFCKVRELLENEKMSLGR